jgi:hypothetical protein
MLSGECYLTWDRSVGDSVNNKEKGKNTEQVICFALLMYELDIGVFLGHQLNKI